MTNSRNCIDLPTISYTNCKELLHFAQKHGIISNIEDVLKNIENMKNLEIIQQHPYKIFQGSNSRWYTYLPDKEKPHGRRQIAKSSQEAIHKAIIEDYKKRAEEESLENMNQCHLVKY